MCDREGVEVVACSRAYVVKSVYNKNTPIYQCMCIVCEHVCTIYVCNVHTHCTHQANTKENTFYREHILYTYTLYTPGEYKDDALNGFAVSIDSTGEMYAGHYRKVYVCVCVKYDSVFVSVSRANSSVYIISKYTSHSMLKALSMHVSVSFPPLRRYRLSR